MKRVGGFLKIVRSSSLEKDSARKKKIFRGSTDNDANGAVIEYGRSARGIKGRDKHIIIAVIGRSTGPASSPENEYLMKKKRERGIAVIEALMLAAIISLRKDIFFVSVPKKIFLPDTIPAVIVNVRINPGSRKY